MAATVRDPAHRPVRPPLGPADARSLIAAAVAAGVPAGLLFALTGFLMAMPPLLEAEAFEEGGALPAAADVARLLWGLAGSVGLGTALALVLAPIVRATGAPGWRTGLAVGALAFLAVFLLPALVTRPGPPGIEHAGPMALRQGFWVAAVAVFAAAWGAGLLRYRRGAPGSRTRVRAVGLGVSVWVACMGLLAAVTGFTPGPEAGPVPGPVTARFVAAAAVTNACLFAALGLLIPPALRRFCP